MKNSNDAIGNRTRDFPAYSAVHQPTVPQLHRVIHVKINPYYMAPKKLILSTKKKLHDGLLQVIGSFDKQ